MGSSNSFYTLSFIVWTDKVQIIQTQQDYEKNIYNTFPQKSSKLARLTWIHSFITKVYNCLVLRFFFLFFPPDWTHHREEILACLSHECLANASELCQQTAFIHSRWHIKVSLNVERVFSELKSGVICFSPKTEKRKKNRKKI